MEPRSLCEDRRDDERWPCPETSGQGQRFVRSEISVTPA